MGVWQLNQQQRESTFPTMNSLIPAVVHIGSIGCEVPVGTVTDGGVAVYLWQDSVHLHILLGLLCPFVRPDASDKVVSHLVMGGGKVERHSCKLCSTPSLQEEDGVVGWDVSAEGECTCSVVW